MADTRRLGTVELVLFLVVLLVAAGARAGYLYFCADKGQSEGPVQVQDAWPPVKEVPAGTEVRGRQAPTELDQLVHNLKGSHEFKSAAPLSRGEEKTAHRAPGYPFFLSWLGQSPV